MTQESSVLEAARRGYFGVAVWNPKKSVNVGGVWRSAHIFGAAFLATIGHRYQKQPADTTCAARHVPLWAFVDSEDFWAHIPHDCRPVAVEIADRARPIADFVHPPRAVYILGPEDGSLPESLMDRAYAVVRLPGTLCMNLASAASVVMYDRHSRLAAPPEVA